MKTKKDVGETKRKWRKKGFLTLIKFKSKFIESKLIETSANSTFSSKQTN